MANLLAFWDKKGHLGVVQIGSEVVADPGREEVYVRSEYRNRREPRIGTCLNLLSQM